MRRVCIAASIAVNLAGTFSGSALTQSLRPSYAPDGQSGQSAAPKRAAHAAKIVPTVARKPAQRLAVVPQIDSTAAAQTYAPPLAAPTPLNRGLNDFFATIFAGPIMLARAFHPTNRPTTRQRQATHRRLIRRKPTRRRTSPILVMMRSIRDFSGKRLPIRAGRRRARSLSIPATNFFI